MVKRQKVKLILRRPDGGVIGIRYDSTTRILLIGGPRKFVFPTLEDLQIKYSRSDYQRSKVRIQLRRGPKAFDALIVELMQRAWSPSEVTCFRRLYH